MNMKNPDFAGETDLMILQIRWQFTEPVKEQLEEVIGILDELGNLREGIEQPALESYRSLPMEVDDIREELSIVRTLSDRLAEYRKIALQHFNLLRNNNNRLTRLAEHPIRPLQFRSGTPKECLTQLAQSLNDSHFHVERCRLVLGQTRVLTQQVHDIMAPFQETLQRFSQM